MEKWQQRCKKCKDKIQRLVDTYTAHKYCSSTWILYKILLEMFEVLRVTSDARLHGRATKWRTQAKEPKNLYISTAVKLFLPEDTYLKRFLNGTLHTDVLYAVKRNKWWLFKSGEIEVDKEIQTTGHQTLTNENCLRTTFPVMGNHPIVLKPPHHWNHMLRLTLPSTVRNYFTVRCRLSIDCNMYR